MSSSMLLIIIIAIFATMVLVAIMFLTSGEDKAKRRKKREAEPPDQNKNWPLMVQGLEKHAQTLKREIENLEKQIRAKEKDLGVEKLKNTQLQAKLAQEKSWREKEQASIEKQNQESHQFKQELLKAERNLEEEHALRLRQERELTEAKRPGMIVAIFPDSGDKYLSESFWNE